MLLFDPPEVNNPENEETANTPPQKDNKGSPEKYIWKAEAGNPFTGSFISSTLTNAGIVEDPEEYLKILISDKNIAKLKQFKSRKKCAHAKGITKEIGKIIGSFAEDPNQLIKINSKGCLICNMKHILELFCSETEDYYDYLFSYPMGNMYANCIKFLIYKEKEVVIEERRVIRAPYVRPMPPPSHISNNNFIFGDDDEEEW